MKDWHKEPSAEEQRQFDLLADGELDEARRHELLASLDERPEGWRHCALALLEAQAWRRHSREWAQSGDFTAAAAMLSAPQVASDLSRQRTHGERVRLVLAMAASFLLAFGLSWLLRGGAVDGEAEVGTPQMAQSGDAENRDRSLANPAADEKDDALGDGGMVTLASDSEESLEVPYVSADRFDPSLFASQPAGLPAELLRKLQRTGHQIRQSRQLVPFDLQDGRQLVLPVDQVDVEYVGHGYQ